MSTIWSVQNIALCHIVVANAQGMGSANDPNWEHWLRQLNASVRAAGGTVVGQLGTHAAIAFDRTELTDAIDLALALLDQCDNVPDAPPIAFAICMDADDVPREKSISNRTADRCLELVARARAGELLLSPEVHHLVHDRYSFDRSVGKPGGLVRGYSIARSSKKIPMRSEPPEGVVQEIIASILAGDFDATEKRLASALREGKDQAATERVRALIHLLRGDVSKAMRVLATSRLEGKNRRQVARASLVLALVLLQAGDAGHAIRAALGALAVARSTQDRKGESAALHTLAACYRFLGRDVEALAIQNARDTSSATKV